MSEETPIQTDEQSAQSPVRGTAPLIIRILSLLIDTLVLMAAGLVLGLIFNNRFVRMGWTARFVGLFLSVLYYSLFGSRVFWGQTVGQMAVKTVTVDKDGRLLTFSRSLVRSLFIPVIVLLNGWAIPGASLDPVWGMVQGGLLFALILLECYFILFNRKTRQSLHDLVSGSYVVKVGPEGHPLPAETGNRKVVYLCSALPAALVIAAVVLISSFAQRGALGEMMALSQKLQTIEGIETVALTKNFLVRTSAKGQVSSVNLNYAGLKTDPHAKKEQLVRAVASVVLEDPATGNVDMLRISIVTGYDIGIFSWKMTFNEHWTIENWKARLAEPETP